jgi:thiamine pyrophosphokinase
MQHGTLPFGATLGVSNVLTSATAGVTLESGLLLAIHISNVQ